MDDTERRLKEYLDRNVEGLEHSDLFCSLFTANYRDDPYCSMQLGLAVMMDKPIFLIVPYGLKVPENLVRLARHIEYCDISDPNSIQQAADAIQLLSEAMS